MSRLRYLLDTNIVSHLMRYPNGPVAQRIESVGAERIAVSIVVVCELRFGVAKRSSSRLAERVALVLEHIPALPFEHPTAEHYASIRSVLEQAGTPIGPNDLLIAAHARALGMVLVTDNVSEFGRVPDLSVENWLVAPTGA